MSSDLLDRPDLLDRLRSHVRDADLFPQPGLALLAVSGGPDSVVLLDVMTRLAGELGLEIAVGHVDHGIHGESADVAERVMGLAVRLGVPGHLDSLRLGADATETRSRHERYAALRRMMQRVAARYLVTAHHADDQIETVLFRLLRGTGPSGMAGIASRRPDGLVRPLLPFRKHELTAWLDRVEDRVGRPVTVHIDPANTDPRHQRSWIRQCLLPLLRERFGAAVDDHLLQAAAYAASDRDAWGHVLQTVAELEFRASEGVVEVARAPLRRYDDRLSNALLRALAHEAGAVLGPRRAARLRARLLHAPSGRVFQLGQGWVAEVAFDRLRILPRFETSGPDGGTILEWGVNEAGEVRWDRWRITWRREPASRCERRGGTTWVTDGAGTVRPPRPGDRLEPLGGRGHRRVSRLLMEHQVPRSERGRYPVVVRNGEILWLPGVCRAGSAVPVPGESAIRLDASLS